MGGRPAKSVDSETGESLMLSRKIVFTKKLPFPYKYADLYTLEPGKFPVRMTNGSDAEPPYDSAGGDFSGDGQFLVFDSSRDTGLDSEIYKIKLADPSVVMRLTTTVGNEDCSWNRSSGVIAFSSERNGSFGAFTMEPDGTNQIEIIPGQQREILWPKWNSVGNKIVFVEEFTRMDVRVFWVDISDFDNKHYLTSLHPDNTPTFSPPLSSTNEEKVLFPRKTIVNGAVEKTDLYTINLDGTGISNITNAPAGTHFECPSWSPDGRFIIFSKKVGAATFQLYEMEVAGGSFTQITNDSGFDHFAPAYVP